MADLSAETRGQIGIGTLAVFIAMVLVALIAGGVLIETTGVLQGKSSATGEQSSAQVTDRVGVESATASYSSGGMQRIDIVLSKAPGSGDVDLSEVVVHWLGPNGSTELTDSTFSISPVKGSGTVLKQRPDRMNLSNFGKTIPDGTPATVRFITADGGTTTVILRTPNAPPKNGSVSLLWRSPSGNPAGGSGTATAMATATATATPSGPTSTLEWTYSGHPIRSVAASESALYATSGSVSFETRFLQMNADDGSLIRSGGLYDDMRYPVVDSNDRMVIVNDSYGEVWRWDPTTNSTSVLYEAKSDVNLIEGVGTYSGDVFLSLQNDDYTGEIERRQTDETLEWETDVNDSTSDSLRVTDSALYTWQLQDTLKKRDHSGSVSWSTTVLDGDLIRGSATGPGEYVYATVGDAVFQLYKSNGTKTSFSLSDPGEWTSITDLETDSDGYLYLDENQNLTVIDPADGSVVLRRDLGWTVDSIALRSDGVYIAGNDKLAKVTVQNLP